MNKPDDVGIGLIGFGTIGTGVVRTLTRNRKVIGGSLGFNLNIVKIADVDVATDRGVRVPPSILTTDAAEVTRHPRVGIVIELIGGTTPAREFILDAIRHGKHVVTANKELIAKHGAELIAAAESRGVALRYEASVGGGIPILTPLLTCLRANRVTKITGIVNGTTNYILTRMEQADADFEDALAEAQRKGYAEADPTADVDGFDSAYKIAILTAVAFGRSVPVGRIHREGIRRVTRDDIRYAAELGYRIRLIAVSRAAPDAQDVRVHPALVPAGHP
ncbi:MAG: homoserine dehydrogenase, partial [bacterium]